MRNQVFGKDCTSLVLVAGSLPSCVNIEGNVEMPISRARLLQVDSRSCLYPTRFTFRDNYRLAETELCSRLRHGFVALRDVWYLLHVLALLTGASCNWGEVTPRLRRASQIARHIGGDPCFREDGTVEGIAFSGGDPADVDRKLSNLHEFDEVEWLNFDGCPISNEGTRYLRGCPRLKRLWLTHARASNRGLVFLETLTLLEWLNLSGTLITDDGLAYLSSLVNLRELWLAETQLTGDGFRFLENLDKLRFLDATRTIVTDQGVSHLSRLRSLQELYLDGTQITDASVPHLVKLRGLQWLSIADTGITPDGVSELRNALPNCVVDGGETRKRDTSRREKAASP